MYFFSFNSHNTETLDSITTLRFGSTFAAIGNRLLKGGQDRSGFEKQSHQLCASQEVEELKRLFVVLVPLLLVACGGIDKEKLRRQVVMLVVQKISSDLNIKDDPPEITLLESAADQTC